ncbi:MAG: hypothetical protein ACYDBJ_26595, partial [Aggregatilineales bacterium]
YGNGLKKQSRPNYDKRKQWDRLAFNLEGIVNPPPVELTHYDSLGNEISTWTEEWESKFAGPVSTSRFE